MRSMEEKPQHRLQITGHGKRSRAANRAVGAHSSPSREGEKLYLESAHGKEGWNNVEKRDCAGLPVGR